MKFALLIVLGPLLLPACIAWLVIVVAQEVIDQIGD